MEWNETRSVRRPAETTQQKSPGLAILGDSHRNARLASRPAAHGRRRRLGCNDPCITPESRRGCTEVRRHERATPCAGEKHCYAWGCYAFGERVQSARRRRTTGSEFVRFARASPGPSTRLTLAVMTQAAKPLPAIHTPAGRCHTLSKRDGWVRRIVSGAVTMANDPYTGPASLVQ
jgi:hypothetical protein